MSQNNRIFDRATLKQAIINAQATGPLPIETWSKDVTAVDDAESLINIGVLYSQCQTGCYSSNSMLRYIRKLTHQEARSLTLMDLPGTRFVKALASLAYHYGSSDTNKILLRPYRDWVQMLNPSEATWGSICRIPGLQSKPRRAVEFSCWKLLDGIQWAADEDRPLMIDFDKSNPILAQTEQSFNRGKYEKYISALKFDRADESFDQTLVTKDVMSILAILLGFKIGRRQLPPGKYVKADGRKVGKPGPKGLEGDDGKDGKPGKNGKKRKPDEPDLHRLIICSYLWNQTEKVGESVELEEGRLSDVLGFLKESYDDEKKEVHLKPLSVALRKRPSDNALTERSSFKKQR
ncbi:MAG: hypothetical protein M1814_000905 [Vezdaea aestivalis]|nr:MAG: hypothetical protein M1814_000905 [Vezdaea aestivalis]